MIDGRNMEATGGVKQSKTPGLSESRLISRVGLSQLPNSEVRRRGFLRFLRAGEESAGLGGLSAFHGCLLSHNLVCVAPCRGRRQRTQRRRKRSGSSASLHGFHNPGGRGGIKSQSIIQHKMRLE